MRKRRDFHVVPSPGGGWLIREAGGERISQAYARKDDAIQRARNLARGLSSELIIHGRDGRIKEHHTHYREAPLPPSDRRHHISAPKGFGSLSKTKFALRRDIDVTKPIYEQTKKKSSKDKRKK